MDTALLHTLIFGLTDSLLSEVSGVTSLVPGSVFPYNPGVTFNDQTGSIYNAQKSDVDVKIIRMNVTSSSNVVAIPNDDVNFVVGDTLRAQQQGTGPTSFFPASGVTVISTGLETCRARYSIIVAIKLAAGLWLVCGDMSS